MSQIIGAGNRSKWAPETEKEVVMTTEILNLARAIEIVTAVHTSDHPRGFAVNHAATVFDQRSVKPQDYVEAWKLLRRAVGKQVAK